MFGIDLAQILNTYGYIGMFVISFLESGVFFLLPGDSLLFTAGVLASQNYLSLIPTIITFFVGTFLGSMVGYEIGKRLHYFEKFSFIKKYILSDKYIKEAHDVFVKSGDKIMLVNRFIPLLRTFAPIIAGLVNMNYKKFVIYNLFGAGLWSVSVVSLGYYLGIKFAFIQEYISIIMILILIATVAPVAYKVVKKYNRQNRQN